MSMAAAKKTNDVTQDAMLLKKLMAMEGRALTFCEGHLIHWVVALINVDCGNSTYSIACKQTVSDYVVHCIRREVYQTIIPVFSCLPAMPVSCLLS